MAVSSFIYGGVLQSLANKEIDFDGDSLKVMLCTSGYVPLQDSHRYKSAVTSEVVGSGYTAGGKALTGVTVSYNAELNQLRIDADDVFWSPSLITARYAVIYDDTPSTNKPLIGYVDFGQDVSSNNSALEIRWNSLSLFRFSAGSMAGGVQTGLDPAPVGIAGNWDMKFQDNFDSIAPSVWTPYWMTTSGSYRNVTTDPSNVTASGGQLQLTLSAATHGAVLSSNPNDGVPGHTGFQFQYGYVEARMWFPGPTNDKAYNWAGLSIRGQDWPTDGQSDIVETAGWDANGRFTINYHYDSDGNTTPGVYVHQAVGTDVLGSYANGWHTFGVHRKPGVSDFYYDGVKVWTTNTFDGGRPQYLLFNIGNSSISANQMFGAEGRLLVDYVRVWEEVSGGPATEDPEPTSGTLRYVSSSTGSDSNPGTKAAPWATLTKVRAALDSGEVGRGDTVMLKRGDTFPGWIQFPVIQKTTGVFTMRPYGSGDLPKISGYKVSGNSWVQSSTGIWRLNITANSGQYTGNTSQTETNVGFLMVNGQIKGAKKLSLGSVTSPWDFYSDGTYVYVRLDSNPGAGVEISVRQNGIRPASNSEVWGMHVVGHGAHGFAQYNSNNVYVHDCIIENIGGSLLNTDTRYGNCIEIWIGNSNTTYSNNIIRQSYDCGITMQGTQEGTTTQWTNVHVDNNVFENCFQTFEVWSRGSGTGWVGCSFNGNTSLNAGYSWSAAVRGDPNSGVHFLSYDMQLSASGLEMANNTFRSAKNAYAYCTWPIGDGQFPNVNSHDNTIILEAGRKIVWQHPETIEQAAAWKSRTGKEVNSTFYVLGNEPTTATYETNFGTPQHEDGTTYTYPNLLNFGATNSPPLAQAPRSGGIDFVAHWYNDFGLDHVALSSNSSNGWYGWYDWQWNFPTNTGDGVTTLGYDSSRHPLQGFYKGDDPNVLGWQCYWMAHASKVNVVALTQSAGFTSTNWSQPASGSYWVYQLFHNVPNFLALKYALSIKCAGTTAEIEAQNTDLVNTYAAFPQNPYVFVENGLRYAVVTAWEFEQIRGIYDNYNGQTNTGNYLKAFANKFKAIGYDGVMILARNSGVIGATPDPTLKPAGVYVVVSDYENAYATNAAYGNNYANYANNVVFPSGANRALNIVTSAKTQFPHPSGWNLAGSTPALFQTVAQKAVDATLANGTLPIITIYNVSEWAEGGPGLIPNKRDGFGYLDALGTVIENLDGVTAAETHGWGAVKRGDEFDYIGAPNASKWSVYNSAGHAGNGLRSPSAWYGDGRAMRVSGDANGTTGGMSSQYDRNLPLYHRVETRMRTSARHPEYHPVMLLWPDDAGSVISGVPEVDYAEGTGDTTKIKFFLHYGTSSQTFAERVIDTTEWHNYAVEWGPNAVVGYIDGVEWFRDTDPAHIPSIPMHSTLQLDWFPNDSPDASPPPSWMEIAWTRGYDI